MAYKITNPSALRFLLVLCVVLLWSGITAFGQAGSGGITGLVTDPSGDVIPGASVTLHNDTNGLTLKATSNASGLYSFISLTPGEYDVTAKAKGFGAVIHKSINVTLDETSTINFKLTVATVGQSVTVTATSDLASTSNSTVGQLIGAATIDRVPLLTRDVYNLIELSNGVTPANGTSNSSSSQAIESISNGRPNIDVSSYTINGAIQGSVYYMIDGSPIGIAENNAAAILPAMDIPEDDVDEVRVETQNTPASFQSGGAGVISVATKSGGNHFHGDAFAVFRPNVLAANDYFNKQFELGSGLANSPQSFHRYQEGGAIGGPILHNKLFFFGDYQGTQQGQADSERFVVPTTAERNGDFSADPFTIYNPAVPDISSGPLAGTRQPFQNNIIAQPNPIAEKFLSEMPKCNLSQVPGVPCDQSSDDMTPNYFIAGTDPHTSQKFDIRMDWVQSQRQRIFGRFSFSRILQSNFNAFGNMWDPNFAENVTNARNILLGDNFTFNPTTVLQLRYSFTRHYENQGGAPGQSSISIASLGFPQALAAQVRYKNLPLMVFDDNGSSVGGTGNYNTFQYASENSDANVALTKDIGKHEISFGFEYMKRFMNVGQPPASGGEYSFDISSTDQTVNTAVGGSDFASALTGMGEVPGAEGGDYPNFTIDAFVAEASPYYGAFIQDNWHPLPTLTINAGLRWDIFGGKTERHNRLEYFNPTVTNTVDGVPYTGAEIYVNNGNRSPFTTNMDNFGPRLGISWQPKPFLVFRGGAGFYYGPSAQMPANAGLDSDGYSTQTFWNSTAWNNDPNTEAYDCAQNSNNCGNSLGNTVVVNSLSNPFPNGVVQPISSPTGLANNLGLTLNTMLHSQRTPTTYNFNFGWELQLPQNFVLSAAYVGSRGLFLPLSTGDLNTLPLSIIGKYQAALLNSSVPNQWEAIQPGSNANSGSGTVPLFVSLQEFPQFGNGSYGDGNGVLVHGYPGGDSDYSSLQTKLQKRLTNHFTLLSSFTWAKLITDDGNPPLGFVGSHLGAPQDWKDMQYEHAVSPQDIEYQFTTMASYDLPIGHGRAIQFDRVGDAILGGWMANGIFYWSSGVPIAAPTVGAGLSYFDQRPDMTCNPGAGAPHTTAHWFNPDCFTMPASSFVPGNAPAYLAGVRAMGTNDVDISLRKVFHLGEARTLRFEVTSYNIANRPQFGMPNVESLTSVQTNPASAALFGQITNTLNSPRQFQFGSRFTF